MKNQLLTIAALLFSSILLSQSSYSLQEAQGWHENKGQITDYEGNARPDVHYSHHSLGVSFFLTPDGILQDFKSPKQLLNNRLESTGEEASSNSSSTQYWETRRLGIEFVDANPNVKIEGQNPLRAYSNYYLRGNSSGITSVKSYEKIIYRNLWNKIDMAWILTSAGEMKYEFYVHPGGNPADIKLHYRGPGQLTKKETGALHYENELGWLSEEAPISFQGESRIITEYILSERTLSFKIKEYDPDETLVIDPVRIWGTYFGGEDDDYGLSVTTDPSGNIYLTGGVQSNTMMASAGAQYQSNSGGTFDGIITKFDSSGNQLWSSYLGGTNQDVGKHVAYLNNQVIIGGQTNSPDFPTSGAYQNSLGGNDDAFITSVFPSNGYLDWSTYLGGSGSEDAYSLAANISGIFLIGYTNASDFPTTSGVYQENKSSDRDGFIAYFNLTGSNLVWSTFLGGNGKDEIYTAAIDNAGSILIAGETESTDLSINGSNSGGNDGFIASISANGQTLNWGAYIGGSQFDHIHTIGLDFTGNIYFGGVSSSSGLSVGITSSFGGTRDAFLGKLTSTGTTIWQRYYGGSARDSLSGLYVNDAGRIYFGGDTRSTSGISKFVGLQDTTYGGGEDAYLSCMDTNGSLLWGSYIGGPNKEENRFVAQNINGDIIAIGRTASTTGIVAGNSPHQGTKNTSSPNDPTDIYLVSYREYPDLRISAVTLPDSLYSFNNPSDTIAIEVTVKNLGLVEAKNTFFKIYLASFPQVALIDTLYSSGSFSLGTNDEMNFSIDLGFSNQITSGDYYLVLSVDPFNLIDEPITENNKIEHPFFIPSLEADLTISSSSIPDSLYNDIPTDSLSISVTVNNDGLKDITNASYKIYLSETPQLTNITTVFESNDFNINRAEEKTFMVDLVFDERELGGDFYLTLEVDPEKVVDEISEVNNIFQQAIYLPPILPDLELDSWNPIGNAYSFGDSVDLSFTIRNSGAISTSASQLEVYVSLDTFISTDDVLVLSSPIASLSKNQEILSNESIELPSTFFPGTHHIILALDPQDVVSELSESNNEEFQSFDFVASSLGSVQVSDVTISANIVNAQAVTASSIFTKPMSSGDWSTLDGLSFIDKNDGKFEYEADINSGDEQGLKVYFSIAAGSDISFSDTIYLYRSVNETTVNISGGSEEADYLMFSIPLELTSQDLQSVLTASLGEQDNKVWRAFQYRSGQEFENPSSIEAGKAYWIISKEDASISFGAGSTVEVESPTPFVWKLNAGWNQIGNPYRFTLSWQDILTHNGNPTIDNPVIFETGTGFQRATTINTASGAYIFVDNALDLEVPLYKNPSVQRLEGPYLSHPLDAEHWEVALSISDGVRTDKTTILGMQPSASNAVEVHDTPPIPQFAEAATLLLQRNGVSLSRDMAALAKTGNWDIVLHAARKQEVMLSWESWFFGDNDYTLILEDLASGRLIDMRYQTSLTVPTNGEDQNFRIHYGDKQYLNELLLPLAFSIEMPYPNPIEQHLHIPMQVPGAGTISIRLLNINGQEVGRMESEAVSSGFQTILWEEINHLPIEDQFIILQAVWESPEGATQSASRKILTGTR